MWSWECPKAWPWEYRVQLKTKDALSAQNPRRPGLGVTLLPGISSLTHSHFHPTLTPTAGCSGNLRGHIRKWVPRGLPVLSPCWAGPSDQGSAHRMPRAHHASSFLWLWGFLWAWVSGMEGKLCREGIPARILPKPGMSGRLPGVGELETGLLGSHAITNSLWGDSSFSGFAMAKLNKEDDFCWVWERRIHHQQCGSERKQVHKTHAHLIRLFICCAKLNMVCCSYWWFEFSESLKKNIAGI